ncbi:MAG: DDE-type integrase/transposase/recombinase [Candidatus Hodarchaeota archaeon]
MTKLKREKYEQYEEARELYFNKGWSAQALAQYFRKSVRTMQRWVKKMKENPRATPLPAKEPDKRGRKYPPELFDRILALKRELPNRSAAWIHRLLQQETSGQCPSVSTIRKYLRDQGLTDRPSGRVQGYIKFARSRPNDLWQIDIAGVQTVGHLGPLYLIGLLDDCSRYVVAAHYFPDQKGRNVLRVLQQAVLTYGRPLEILADNGAQFNSALGELSTKYTKILDHLDIKPIFASPGHPQTKGKLERWFGTVIQMFLGEARVWVASHPSCSLTEFNHRFQDWLMWYNTTKPHRSLPDHCPPAQRYLNHPARVFRPLQAQVNWGRWLNQVTFRKVTKYNQIAYKAQHFDVPPGYVHSRVEVIEFDDRLEIYWKNQCLATHPYEPVFRESSLQPVQRKIKPNGEISYQGQRYSIDYKQAGRTVEVQEINLDKEFLVYLNGILIRTCKRKES